MRVTSYYDTQKAFLRGIVARDIAEPLPSFDATTPSVSVREIMEAQGFEVAGIRVAGLVAGYVTCAQLDAGSAGDHAQPFAQAEVVADSALLGDVLAALNRAPVVFVTLLGRVGGVITRSDLQDPPVRMWLFGLITELELGFRSLIETHYPDGGWTEYISPGRLEKARALQAERARRRFATPLVECLQFADTAQIVARSEVLRGATGFVSRKRADLVIKQLERLRNNLAHAQDIVTFDWEIIIGLGNGLERVLELRRGVSE